ncbi:ATP-dependent helicase, partial [Pseudomonas sp. GP01-A3]
MSTRFNDRSKTLDQLVTSVYENISTKKGNYLVFFPSYQYLKQCVELFTEKYELVEIIVQENGMTEEEREEFLLKFDQNNADSLV